ncbi:MAG: DUF1343 domain-containing protein [Aestuariibacter sp.]|uniref:exo-beta-N-acetylmuramidase NamZ family protein n=1 Tax=Marisediminitalea aggregata TaxID=634436 RepID=UPI0020CC6B35|nr:DUF1343 domain-containing protein [Marisediminitalea aggregata]MCP3863812.1 DUF1343 domain-containing protein [Aestuariibacter sp.]MCP4527869.1 DUF1343 domain-containing protein [Aestuariibacter sp.]MCP9477842.1 DUF1343 domain-containing protein [Marisediminitalea aggregata]
MKGRVQLIVVTLLTVLVSFSSQAIIVGAEQPAAYLPLLQGKQVGLVVNQTSRVRDQHLVDFLLSQHITITSVFAPEHGFRGNAGAGETISDGTDAKTGLPIRSLYGKTKKPTPAMLAGIDILVFDIQDVGARFYTYISTLHYVMEAAAEQGIAVLVLDRPNPNGRFVDGPVLDLAFQSFVGMHPIPLLHGMTVGELALMIRGEQWINSAQALSLTIVPVFDYRKTDRYVLPVPPSPNLPNEQAIRLYPSLCLFEATEISVGRGTPWPFQVIGHPDVALGEFAFTPVSMPESAPNPKHQDMPLQGLNLTGSTMEGFDISLLLTAIQAFKESDKPLIDRARFFDLLSGTDSLRQQINKGDSLQAIRASWQPALAKYQQRRQPYLLYPLN